MEEFHSSVRQASLISWSAMFDVVRLSWVPMMPSTWLSICAKCSILVRQGVGKVSLRDQLAMRRIGGQAVVENP